MAHSRKKVVKMREKTDNRTTVDFTEAAKPVFDSLVGKYGSVKRVVSAAVLALNNLSPDEREKIMNEISGDNPVTLTLSETRELLAAAGSRSKADKIIADFLRRRENRRQRKQKGSLKSA